jgi:adenylate kinase family enzyme
MISAPPSFFAHDSTATCTHWIYLYVWLKQELVALPGETSDMAITIFLLGRPGSGKSTAARFIDRLSKQQDWSTIHLNDYPFLFAQFEADIKHLKFRPADCGGFDVIDFSVLDTVLQSIENKALAYMAIPDTLLLIEFARNDYIQALQQFQRSFLRSAYFLFLKADLDTCVNRVYERSYHPTNRDDHFISEEMIRSYYQKDQNTSLIHDLLSSYGVSERQIHMIENKDTRHGFYEQIKACTYEIVGYTEHGSNPKVNCYSGIEYSTATYHKHPTSSHVYKRQVPVNDPEAS